MDNIQFVIITGLSGAGKTQATRCFEDLGFFCIDNLPPLLIHQFANLFNHSGGKIRKAALVIDTRGGEFFKDLLSSLEDLKKMGYNYQIVFLEANPKTLIRRFKEAKRKHPVSLNGTILQGIKREVEILKEIKSKSNYIIDTTELSPWDLKRKIFSIFSSVKEGEININIISFGFKYGIPLDADFVFDVRFLPNPNYIEELQSFTGFYKPARKFVLDKDVTKNFLNKLYDFLTFLMPYNIEEGKGSLNIAIGCTGGRHRSVVIANELKNFLKKTYPVTIYHRDLKKR